jgi:hypothetical protein
LSKNHVRNICEVEDGQGPVESVAGELKLGSHSLNSGIACQTVRSTKIDDNHHASHTNVCTIEKAEQVEKSDEWDHAEIKLPSDLFLFIVTPGQVCALVVELMLVARGGRRRVDLALVWSREIVFLQNVVHDEVRSSESWLQSEPATSSESDDSYIIKPQVSDRVETPDLAVVSMG